MAHSHHHEHEEEHSQKHQHHKKAHPQHTAKDASVADEFDQGSHVSQMIRKSIKSI